MFGEAGTSCGYFCDEGSAMPGYGSLWADLASLHMWGLGLLGKLAWSPAWCLGLASLKQRQPDLLVGSGGFMV